jgi:hypothetical protein
MLELDDDRLDIYGRRYQPTDEECRWAMMCHLSIYVLAVAGPILILMMKKDESSYIADQAKEALNFQLAMFVAMLVSLITLLFACLTPIFAGAAAILAGMAAWDVRSTGSYYRYPFIFRVVS